MAMRVTVAASSSLFAISDGFCAVSQHSIICLLKMGGLA